ncbi:MAG: AfsR/SARP family transcriptional regulator [Aggregatilineales bacterium]
MRTLSLSLLGSFQVRVEGVPVSHFPYVKLQALLAFLAVESDRPHRRETLAEMLWPDQPDQVARNNLRQSLSRLRKILHEDTADRPHLLVTTETIQLNAASDFELDVATFSALLAECDKHPHQKRVTCSACAQRVVYGNSSHRAIRVLNHLVSVSTNDVSGSVSSNRAGTPFQTHGLSHALWREIRVVPPCVRIFGWHVTVVE